MFISVIETEHNRKSKGSLHAVPNWFDRFGFRIRSAIFVCGQSVFAIRTRGGGGGVLGSIIAGYVPLATQNPYPIIVFSVGQL